MPRWYLGLGDFKADLGITGADNDAALGRAIERASKWLEGVARRVFIPGYGARTFDAPAGLTLWLHDDLDTIGSIVDAGGAFGASDYVTIPNNAPPYAAIELSGTRAWTWSTTRRQAITISGWWGYPTTLATVGALASELSAAATSLTMAGCQAGWMLRVDDELMHVSAVSGSTVTVERAQNGTTAVLHSAAATVRRYEVNPMAADAVAQVATAMFAARETPGVQSRSLGPASVSYGQAGAGGAPQDAMNKAALLKRHV